MDPKTGKAEIKKERAKYWVSVGAQPTDSIHNLLVREGALEGKKIPVHKKPKKEEVKAEGAVATAAAPAAVAQAQETPVAPETSA